MADKIAGIDVHKKVLMVVVVDAHTPESKPKRRRTFQMLLTGGWSFELSLRNPGLWSLDPGVSSRPPAPLLDLDPRIGSG
jgi:hypothetical protein